MALFAVRIGPGAPFQLEVPADVTDRSRKGSVHVMPGTLEVTGAELALLRHDKRAAGRVLTVSEPKVIEEAKANPVAPAAAPAPEPEVEVEDDAH